MDTATILGISLAVVITSAAIVLGGNPAIFIDIPSFLIVFGGSAGVVMARFGMRDFLSASQVAAHAFATELPAMTDIIEELVTLALEARKGGLLALDGHQASQPFLQSGIQMLVDGIAPEMMQQTLENDLIYSQVRHENGQSIFRALGEAAPAMGMIGTLIGLVQMLANMSDPKSIGPAMAIALLTTLYGAFVANMVAAPITGKLELRAQQEAQLQTMIIEGLLCIQKGYNPRLMEDALKNYLSLTQRQMYQEAQQRAQAS